MAGDERADRAGGARGPHELGSDGVVAQPQHRRHLGHAAALGLVVRVVVDVHGADGAAALPGRLLQRRLGRERRLGPGRVVDDE